jgi:hypothetical protein
MGGTIGDIHQNIQQLLISQQQLVNLVQTVLSNQNKIYQRINQLESQANQQLIGLDKRMDSLANVRLIHERERKQVDYQPPQTVLTTQ